MGNKNKIQQKLHSLFISEDATPAISMNNSIRNQNNKINKKGLSDTSKELTNYEKGLGKEEAGGDKIPVNKFNYTNEDEVEYHNEIEIRNGMEMLEYDREPSEGFKKRNKEAIEGSTRMGNKGGKEVGNAQETFGASSDDFGKNFNRISKSSFDKRIKAEKGIYSFGDDVESTTESNKGNKTIVKHSMFENKENNNKLTENNKMKRLKFKKEFNGLGNALKLIPESYKTNNKVFEMTDGNESYRIRWEGSNNGKPVVLVASDKNLVNEDITRMKQLFGYKSQDTLGIVKGNERINENKVFGSILDKTKKLLSEGSDMEGVKATEGNWDEVTKKAPEATKHIHGSVSKDTPIAKATAGNPDKAKKQAPEAKKPLKSSSGKNIESQADYNEGNFDEVTKKAPEATKHINSGKTKMSAVKKETTEMPKNKVKQAPEAKKHIKESDYMSTEGRMNLDELDYMDENMYEGMYEDMHEDMYEGMYEGMDEGIYEDMDGDIDENIYEIEVSESNYPPGAEYDPRAPWNQDEDEDEDDEWWNAMTRGDEKRKADLEDREDEEDVEDVEDNYSYSDEENRFYREEDLDDIVYEVTLDDEEEDETDTEEETEDEELEIEDKPEIEDDSMIELEPSDVDLNKEKSPENFIGDSNKAMLLRNADNPSEYIVKKGNTMYSVPSQFLDRYATSKNRAERIFTAIEDSQEDSGLD